jgi:type II secretory pathway pseudopilin PulG
MTTVPSRQGSRSGFTALELMTVCVIILVLIGILLPIVGKVKRASQIADTQQEISQLSNAITQYFADFHAYPGPFPNSGTATTFIDGETPTPNNADVEAGTTLSLTGVPLELYNAQTPAWPGSTTLCKVTGSENLVLGLLGGLNYNSGTGLLGFNPTEVGLGPLNLNYNYPSKTFISPQRYSPYLQTSALGYLMWCGNLGGAPTRTTQYQKTLVLQPFFDEANRPANDSPIPEFVDRFPSPGPMPILYLRAHVGLAGIVSDDQTLDPVSSLTVSYQYDIRDITPYTNSTIGLPPNTSAIPNPTHNLIPFPPPASVNDILFINQFIAKAGILAKPDVGPYFASQTQLPTDPSHATNADQYYDKTGRPRTVDQYILISAGPDGIYGTGDDITSFGDVMP